MSITLQGSSDDFVTISGDIEDEIYTDNDGEAIIIVSDGTIVRAQYDGIWTMTLLDTGTGKYIEEYKATISNMDDDNYSDIVTIETDITWVASAQRLIKR
mgnify:CR=1 FL=1